MTRVSRVRGGFGRGAGRPGSPIGMMSMFLRKRLLVRATLPVTLAAASGPTTRRFASARAVRSSFRATSTASARTARSRVGSVSLGNPIRPVTVKGPPASSPRNCSKFSVFPAKTSRERNAETAGSVGFANRATLTLISPEPPRTGFAIVPPISTFSATSPSTVSKAGINCRTKFIELRGIRTCACTGVCSSSLRLATIVATGSGTFPVICTGAIRACSSLPSITS